MEPHSEWIEPHANAQDYTLPYGAGVAGDFRVFFIPRTRSVPFRVKSLEANVAYRGFYFNPASGERTDVGAVQPDASGDWVTPAPPIFQDYVFVIERAS